jgi:hypothetical protein
MSMSIKALGHLARGNAAIQMNATLQPRGGYEVPIITLQRNTDELCFVHRCEILKY